MVQDVKITGVVLVCVVMLASGASAVLQAKRYDPGWLQEQKRQTFSVSVPKSDAPCGGIFDHNIACIACVNDACGSLNKGDIINVRYELDTPGCVNRVRIFTEPNNNGKCFAAVIPSVMITG